ncbi:MAG TPA: hypothetical protein DCG12_04420 [Planctomycetaceae bacterium]|nr:hypothetical protein [Planctomycetaceae bacterium]
MTSVTNKRAQHPDRGHQIAANPVHPACSGLLRPDVTIGGRTQRLSNDHSRRRVINCSSRWTQA